MGRYIDGIVKSRHSRETCPRQRSGNGNPENSNYKKILDSCLRRNDKKYPSQTFYDPIYIGIDRKRLFVPALCFLLLFLAGGLDLPLSKEGEDPMDRREEKIRIFREKRALFFKEDPNSPLKESAKKKFKGLIYYPINLKYAVVGSIEKYPTEPKPIYVNLPTNKEREKKYVKYGRFKFKMDNKEYVLHIYRPLGGGELFLPFKDKTSGIETCPEGRYLNVEPMPGGKVLIDFNRAYNPFCEYNEKFTCPFAPKENWLDIEIRSGEKRFL